MSVVLPPRPVQPLPFCVLALLHCATPGPVHRPPAEPVSERTLSARKLQQPLDKHLCKAAVYPAVDKDWRLSTLGPITGRGPTFASAVEALCREADGLSAQAAVALLWREPRGWSTTYEVRATAVRFAADFTLPPSPAPQDLRPPPASDPNVEPPPVGDVGTR